jgi:hypothetical protein
MLIYLSGMCQSSFFITLDKFKYIVTFVIFISIEQGNKFQQFDDRVLYTAVGSDTRACRAVPLCSVYCGCLHVFF